MLDYHFIDPDFRREPKSNHFCHRCQKDISGDFKAIRVSEDGMCAIDPKAKEGYNVEIGPECAKKIPKEYYL